MPDASKRAWRNRGQQALDRAKKTGHQKEAESLITLSVWVLRLLVIVLAISLALTYVVLPYTKGNLDVEVRRKKT